MLVTEKLSIEYTDQAINHHDQEKTFLLLDALMNRENSLCRILEIGPGGGPTIEGLLQYKKSGYTLDDVEVYTLDISNTDSMTLPERMQQLKQITSNSAQIIGDTTNIPLTDKSIDIINSSAVLHEVFSYNNGYEGIEKALNESHRVLKPEGTMIYRDIHPNVKSLHNETLQVYSTDSWRMFSKLFIPYFLEGSRLYSQNTIHLQESKSFQHYTMPAGLAREVQRHYITWKDHFISSEYNTIKIDRNRYYEDLWEDDGFSEKKIYINNASNESHNMNIESDEYGNYIKGSYFDQLIDEQIANILNDVISGEPKAKSAWESWLNREGHESYCYGSKDEIIRLLETGTCSNTNDHSIFTVSNIYEIDRIYYTNYLVQCLGEYAIADKKLLVSLKNRSIND